MRHGEVLGISLGPVLHHCQTLRRFGEAKGDPVFRSSEDRWTIIVRLCLPRIIPAFLHRNPRGKAARHGPAAKGDIYPFRSGAWSFR